MHSAGARSCGNEGVRETTERLEQMDSGYSSELWDSKLGLLDGLGLIELVRGDDGSIVRGRGSWQPLNGDLGYEDLRELLRPGVSLPFRGRAVELLAGRRAWGEVEIEVEVVAVEHSTAAAGLSPVNTVRLEVRPEPTAS
jgi:hypothetical protein